MQLAHHRQARVQPYQVCGPQWRVGAWIQVQAATGAASTSAALAGSTGVPQCHSVAGNGSTVCKHQLHLPAPADPLAGLFLASCPCRCRARCPRPAGQRKSVDQQVDQRALLEVVAWGPAMRAARWHSRRADLGLTTCKVGEWAATTPAAPSAQQTAMLLVPSAPHPPR